MNKCLGKFILLHSQDYKSFSNSKLEGQGTDSSEDSTVLKLSYILVFLGDDELFRMFK